MPTIPTLIITARTFLSQLVPFIIALTVLVFLWGIFKLVVSSNEDTRKEAIKIITLGIVSLFVMVSVWGLVNILIASVGLTGSNSSNVRNGPGIPKF